MTEAAVDTQQSWGYWSSEFDQIGPVASHCAWETFAERPTANTNFLKGVHWAPGGSCCLTASDDNCLRVFDLPQEAWEACQPGSTQGALSFTQQPWQPALSVHAGETVYDYCWYSGMDASNPVSCCFASTSRGQPIRLWDACNGSLRASYRGYDDADEVTAAYSLTFSPDGSRLLAGYGKCLRLFDVARPGRDCSKLMTHRKKQDGSIPGIISCIAFSAVEPDLFVAGSYSRCMGLFDVRTQEQLLLLEGHTGGITQATFSPDGHYLYTGARRDGCIHCWDIRVTGQVLYSMERPTCDTNQRIGFSIEPCGRHLLTGGCDGCVLVFDLTDGHLVTKFKAANDTVNGVAFSPCLPLLATASGHRRYPLLHADDDEQNTHSGGKAGRSPHGTSSGSSRVGGNEAQESSSSDVSSLLMSSYQPGGSCNSLKLWRLQAEWVTAAAGAGAADDPAQG